MRLRRSLAWLTSFVKFGDRTPEMRVQPAKILPTKGVEMLKHVASLVLLVLIAACGVPPEQKTHVPFVQPLSATPDLSPYTRIELYEQGASATKPPTEFQAQFAHGKSQLDVVSASGVLAGRLHVQPDDCRDDPNAACERRFTINGRLQAFGVNLSCLVPVRNDVNVGYGYQTLSGICQSQYGRLYTLQMLPR